MAKATVTLPNGREQIYEQVALAGAENSDGDTVGSVVAEAGFITAEPVVLTSDFTVTINSGKAKGIWVGVAGDVTLVTPNGETVTYPNVPVGQWAFPCTQIKSTVNGTTAAGILAGAW